MWRRIQDELWRGNVQIWQEERAKGHYKKDGAVDVDRVKRENQNNKGAMLVIRA